MPYLATRDVPDVANARALWEKDQWNSDAKAWRETRKTVEWETGQVARAAAAIAEWHRQHPLQSLALRAGLKKSPADLQRLEQTHGESVPFLQGSQRRLNELDQTWPKKSLAYQQQLEREGEEIPKAKRCLGVIDAHPEHFRNFWEREGTYTSRRTFTTGTPSQP